MWLYYWLASAGINPFDDVRTVVVPPPQMVMNMRMATWWAFASVSRGTRGRLTTALATAATSQSIWAESS